MIAGVSFDKDLPQFSPPRAALPTGRQKRDKNKDHSYEKEVKDIFWRKK